ncbi:MAG: TIR domain-containing protein [Acidobacteriota bacterium]|nr:TIR domain-containing protein [Acidobacteriota bacterium]
MDVFLSHNSQDKASVEKLAERLDDFGYQVWFDKWNLVPGDPWQEELEKALEKASCVIVFLGKNLGPWHHEEIRTALEDRIRGKGRVVPVLLPGSAKPRDREIPRFLRRLSWVSFDNLDDNHSFYLLTCGIKGKPPGRPPYPYELLNGTDLNQERLRPKLGANDSWSKYLQRIIKKYKQNSWTKKPIPINISTDSGEINNAKIALLEWSKGRGSRIKFLIGDFGSGKTGLIYWLSYEIARSLLCEDDALPTPIIISLRKSRNLIPNTIEELKSISELQPPDQIYTFDNQEKVLLMIDGLDELLNPRDVDRTPYKRVLSAISEFFPSNIRILVACRTAAFEPISGQVKSAFPRDTFCDIENAFQSAIEEDFYKADTFYLCDLKPEDGDEYLFQTPASNLWQNYRHQNSYKQLTRLPFMVRLLEMALPVLTQREGHPGLDSLYQAAIESWLSLDSRTSKYDVQKLCTVLENIARKKLSEPDIYEYLGIFLNAGVIKQRASGNLEFSHYSLFEFFIARSLATDLLRYNAEFIARLNLIGGYNINRFLIPMLRKKIKTQMPGEKTIRQKFLLKNGEERYISKPVTNQEFKNFLKETKWRNKIGYGIHPAFDSIDGISFSSIVDDNLQPEGPSQPRFDEENKPITTISWYDAYEYCRWVGGRLLKDEEAIFLRKLFGDDLKTYFWGWDWHDEVRSYIEVHNPIKGSKIGVNPDFRHSMISFCVSWPAS